MSAHTSHEYCHFFMMVDNKKIEKTDLRLLSKVFLFQECCRSSPQPLVLMKQQQISRKKWKKYTIEMEIKLLTQDIFWNYRSLK